MASSSRALRKWTAEEDQALRGILSGIAPEQKPNIDWHQVASNIPGRNNKECRKRWIYALEPGLNKGPWTEQEDSLLLEGVRLHGQKWPLVSKTVGTRQPDQCSRRWHESLNPNINHGRWSLMEDQLLREAVQTYGRRWTEIVERYFPDRTPIAAKKRYNQRFGDDARSSSTGGSPSPTAIHGGEDRNGDQQHSMFLTQHGIHPTGGDVMLSPALGGSMMGLNPFGSGLGDRVPSNNSSYPSTYYTGGGSAGPVVTHPGPTGMELGSIWLSNTNTLNPAYPAVSSTYFDQTYLHNQQALNRTPYYERNQDDLQGQFRRR